MTLDEFLDSKQNSIKMGYRTLVKMNYNENIDFIYKIDLNEFGIYRDLTFAGVFEKITKKLYGSPYDLQSSYLENINSKYYAGEISELGDKLFKGADLYLNNYINDNKLELISIAQNTFNKFIADKENYDKLKKSAIKKYIYHNDIENISFSINRDYYNNDFSKIVVEFMQNPIETSYKIYDSYLNSLNKKEKIRYNSKVYEITIKEDIGMDLLINQFEKNFIRELKENLNNEYKKKYDIIGSIKDLEAQMVTITLKHNGEIVTFKYPKDVLYDLEHYNNQIPDLEARERVIDLGFYNKDEPFINAIAKIEYNRKVLYEDKELLNENNKVLEETLDITDEMFG